MIFRSWNRACLKSNISRKEPPRLKIGFTTFWLRVPFRQPWRLLLEVNCNSWNLPPSKCCQRCLSSFQTCGHGRLPASKPRGPGNLTLACELVGLCSTQNGVPRLSRKALLLFSDGTFEYANLVRKLSCGAVLYDPRDNMLLMFGFEIPQALGDV